MAEKNKLATIAECQQEELVSVLTDVVLSAWCGFVSVSNRPFRIILRSDLRGGMPGAKRWVRALCIRNDALWVYIEDLGWKPASKVWFPDVLDVQKSVEDAVTPGESIMARAESLVGRKVAFFNVKAPSNPADFTPIERLACVSAVQKRSSKDNYEFIYEIADDSEYRCVNINYNTICGLLKKGSHRVFPSVRAEIL